MFNHRKLLAVECITMCPSDDFCPVLCQLKCPGFCVPDDLLLRSPPPPPPPPPYDELSKQSQSISTNMIIMACVIGGSFLLGTLCVIFLQYYSKWKFSRRRNSLVLDDTHEDFLDEDHGPVMVHPIWFITTIGLPQSVIDSITVFKYKKDEGLVEGTECSVCLSEFEEDETLRLLPKCSHAFHLPCIDTWLRSHKNCPLCRAPIVSDGADLSAVEANANDLASREEIGTESFRNYGDQLGSDQEGEGGSTEGGTSDHLPNENEKLMEILKKGLPYLNRRNCEFRVQSDLADNRHIEEELQPMRRSVSLNSSSASMIYRAMAEVLEEEGSRHSKLVKDIVVKRGSGSSNICNVMRSSSYKHSLQKGPTSMKRSFSSSGKLFSSRNSRSRSSSVLPL